MDKKAKICMIVLAALVLLGCGSFAAIKLLSPAGTLADIYVDGALYEQVDLSRVKEAYTMEIRTEYGCNTVLVEPGRISVSDSDCPDGICVQMGAISTGGIPVVCMPHRLVIQIEGGEIDAAA